MREERDAFHLAIPVHDLDEARRFYVEQLGCHLARSYPDRITIDFFGDQVVCHLSDEIGDASDDFKCFAGERLETIDSTQD